MIAPPKHKPSLWRILGRWAIAALVVLAAHAGMAWGVVYWSDELVVSDELPAAITIDLTALPVAPQVATEQDVAIGPEMVQSDVDAPKDAKLEPVDVPTHPLGRDQDVKEAEPVSDPREPVEKMDMAELLPELPENEQAEAVIPTPPPPIPTRKPVPAAHQTPTEKPETVSKKKPPSKRVKPPSKAAIATAAPKPVETRQDQLSAAPVAGVSSSTSVATWRGALVAHLNRHKRYPGSGSGTASVIFIIDRSGEVLSAQLLRSAGHPRLDEEAVALAHRASPLPAPPSDLGQGSVTLTVPIRFSR